MIFESKFPKFRLGSHGRGLQFRPSIERGPDKQQFGEFDTSSTDLELSGFESETEAIAAIRACRAFKRGQVWEKTARLDNERNELRGAARASVVADMNEAQLRAVIAASNVAVPGEGADVEQLRKIALGCLSGHIPAGTVVGTTASGDARATEEGTASAVEAVIETGEAPPAKTPPAPKGKARK